MATARQEADWSRTASMMAMTANINRDPKRRTKPFEAYDFMPEPYASKARAAAGKHRRSRGTPITADTIQILRAFLPAEKR